MCLCVCDERRNDANFSVQKKRPSVVVVAVDVVVVTVEVNVKFITHINLIISHIFSDLMVQLCLENIRYYSDHRITEGVLLCLMLVHL